MGYSFSNVGAAYDNWLAQQVDKYMDSSCGGEPQVIDSYQEYDGQDENGNIETSTVYVYSCEECDNDNCEHWKEFHQVEDEEEENQM